MSDADRRHPRRRRYLVALLIGAALLLRAMAAQAGECGSTVGAAPAQSDQEIDARLHFVQRSLRDTALLERRFLLGWGLTYVGLAAGTWVLLPLSSTPEKQRIASAWNSSTSVAAALLLLIDPLQVIRDKNRLESLLAQAPQSSCAVLMKAEQLLKHAADNERGARSARAHIISSLTTVGLGLVLAYALKQPDSAVTSTPIGIFIGELMMASRPLLAVRRLQSYRSGDLSLTSPPTGGFSLGLTPLALNSGYGAAISGAF